MTQAPERIFIAGEYDEYGYYYPNSVEAEGEHGGKAGEYIRADLMPEFVPVEWVRVKANKGDGK